jgi:uncharacterized membrane protein YesL
MDGVGLVDHWYTSIESASGTKGYVGTMNDEVGWAGTVMRALRYATNLIGRNLMILLGILAGGVVLGVAPTIVAGTASLQRMDAQPHPWREFWSSWRCNWGRANLLFIPFWLVLAIGSLDWNVAVTIAGATGAILKGALIFILAWSVVALAHLPWVVDRRPLEAWRSLVLSPLISLPRAGLIILVTAIWLLIGHFVSLVLVLVVPALLLLFWRIIIGGPQDGPTTAAEQPGQ